MSIQPRSARPAAALALALAALSPLLTPAPARAQSKSTTLSALHQLTERDGDAPQSLVIGKDGALYGLTTAGGLGDVDAYPGNGTIFRRTPGGPYRVIFEFKGSKTGSDPSALVPLPDGTLFGATTSGGHDNVGVLFQITPTGSFRLKHQFSLTPHASSADFNGGNPSGPLALGPDGAIYGTATDGGQYHLGIVFRYTSADGLSVLHSFSSNAYRPDGLTLGPDGALYGITLFTYEAGGAKSVATIFRITTAGTYTTVFKFPNAVGGSETYAPPTFGPDGVMYDTTYNGGKQYQGTVFSLTTGGLFHTLHELTGSEGKYPVGPLALGPDGALYGTASEGGSANNGTAFRVTTDDKFTRLYSFPETVMGFSYSALQGADPISVVFGPTGVLYGSAASGGIYDGMPNNLYGYGTVFQLNLPQ